MGITLNYVCAKGVTYGWKTFEKGYNFAQDITSTGGMHKKLWASSVATLALGSRPKQGLAKLETKREAHESRRMLWDCKKV